MYKEAQAPSLNEIGLLKKLAENIVNTYRCISPTDNSFNVEFMQSKMINVQEVKELLL